MINYFKGCMYGLAIGDALGAPVEFLSVEQIYQRYGKEGMRDFVQYNNLGYANYTDDTQMSIAIAKALIMAGHENLETIMDNISKQFIEWLDSPENNRAPGNTCISGCVRLKKGTHWSKSGSEWSKGCGSAMRSAPIGLFYYDNIEKLIEVSIASSKITHAHPTALAASVGTAYLTALAVKKEEISTMIDRLCTVTKNISPEFVEKINQINDVLDLDSANAFEKLGGGWIGEEAVACALYCFLCSPCNYTKTVLKAINSSGDSDSIGCIAGAISGAYNGIENIPEKWVKNIENLRLLDEIADKLYHRKCKSDVIRDQAKVIP